MNIIYTGKPEALTPGESQKIERKFAKLSKLIDNYRGEAEAHVILAMERHLKRAEITVRYHDRTLVSESTAADFFTATGDAIDKLEQQILKVRTKWRDTKRGPKQEPQAASAAAEAPVPARSPKRAAAARRAPVESEEPEVEAGTEVLRVNQHEERKPMTLDEAVLEIDTRDYVVYRDAGTGRVSVLIRRRDGKLDLIEA
jgi:putative sigma-54 modulation protein